MEHYISAMVSMVYEDRAKNSQVGDVPDEFWDALVQLVQEGNIGLAEAAARFDPERNVRFSTYASWWIMAAKLPLCGTRPSIPSGTSFSPLVNTPSSSNSSWK